MSNSGYRIQRFKTIQFANKALPIINKSRSSIQSRQKDQSIVPSSSSNLLKLHSRDKSAPVNFKSSHKLKSISKLQPLIKTIALPSTPLEMDKFYYKNILKSNLAMFQDMLEFVHDGNTPYVYMARANRIAPVPAIRSASIQTEKRPCCCPIQDKKLSFIRQCSKVFPQKPRENVSKVKQVFFNPQSESRFPEKVVIINVEGVLLQTGCIRPRLISSLLKLQKHYRIILVKSSDISNFVHFLANEKIRIAGIYEKLALSKRVVDYSRIYKDFNVSWPAVDCLIVSTINSPLEDLEDRSGEELIAFQHGLNTHLLVSNPPLPFSDNTKNACMLLIPMLNIGEPSIPMTCIVSLIKSVKNCSFDQILKLRNVESLSSSVVMQALLEQSFSPDVQQIRSIKDNCSLYKCKVHSSPAHFHKKMPVLSFGVLKNSFFPANTMPLIFF